MKLFEKWKQFLKKVVAPHAGAWIETNQHSTGSLKEQVAPHAGAWIETIEYLHESYDEAVAPHAGAWIETRSPLTLSNSISSLPMRERGLKHRTMPAKGFGPSRRSPCGSVD